MADPQDGPDEGSGAIPPARRQNSTPKKAAPKKVPAKASKKAPAKKAVAKKAPAKAAKKAAAKQAAPRPAGPPQSPPPPPTPINLAPSASADATSSARGAANPLSPTVQPADTAGRARIPLAIGVAAASLVAMLIRRLRRD